MPVLRTRQLKKENQEHYTNLFSTYVNMTKAFYTVNRQGMWKIKAKYGCPRKFITLVRYNNEEIQARVQDSGGSS